MTISALPEIVILFLVCFARIGAMMMLFPGIGEQMVLARARLGLALLVALLVVPIIRPIVAVSGLSSAQLIGLILGEVLVGLVFGVATRLVMSTLQTAGTVIALQMGLSFAQAFDPDRGSNAQAVILSNFMTLLGIALVFATNLHHVAIMGMIDSYRTLTPGNLPATGDAADLAIGIASASFSVAMQISAPFLVFGLVFNVGLGLLSRMMPQIQVFFLALPANILLGTLVLVAVLSMMMDGFLAHAMATFRQLFPGL